MISEINLNLTHSVRLKEFLIFGALLIALAGCKKTKRVEKVQTATFIHSYQMPGSQSWSYIRATSDGGYLIVAQQSTTNLSEYLLIKADFSGKVQWTKTFGDSVYTPQVTELADGSILLSDFYRCDFWKINKEGESITKITSSKYTSNANYSYVIEDHNGTYLRSYSQGGYGYTPDSNYVERFSYNGTSLGTRKIKDSDIGYKLLALNVYAFTPPSTYYFSGLLYHKKNWAWSDHVSMYLAKITYNGADVVSKKVTLIDTINIGVDNYSPYPRLHFPGYDNSVLFEQAQNDKNIQLNKAHFVKADSTLDISWQKDLIIDHNKTFLTSMKITSDGNFLVCGCTTAGYNSFPFAAKLSPDCEVIWSWSYEISYSGFFTYGQQLNDGSYIFTGCTEGFGKGLNQTDVFMMKTDKNGDVK
jgi:hypothetical protein